MYNIYPISLADSFPQMFKLVIFAGRQYQDVSSVYDGIWDDSIISLHICHDIASLWYTAISPTRTNQGCILTFWTTLAKFTSCLMYAITYTWFQPSIAVIQIMLVIFQCLISSIIVATEHFHVGWKTATQNFENYSENISGTTTTKLYSACLYVQRSR